MSGVDDQIGAARELADSLQADLGHVRIAIETARNERLPDFAWPAIGFHPDGPPVCPAMRVLRDRAALPEFKWLPPAPLPSSLILSSLPIPTAVSSPPTRSDDRAAADGPSSIPIPPAVASPPTRSDDLTVPDVVPDTNTTTGMREGGKPYATVSWHECQRDDACRMCRAPSVGNETGEDGAGWGRFAMCACICLQDRADRLESSAQEFHRIGMCRDMFYYRPARPDPAAVHAAGFERVGGYGSWESHRTVARKALQLGVFETARQEGRVPAVIVLEDDVRFLGDMTETRIGRLEEQIAGMPEGWHVLLLGHSPMPVPGTCRPAKLFASDWSVWRVNSFMLHAYILSEAGAKLLAATPYHAYASIDYLMWGRGRVREHFLDDWMRHNTAMYAVLPMMCVQADTPSDQRLDGKEFGIRLHARLARCFPWFLETLFMIIPFITLILVLVVATLYFLVLARFAWMPLPKDFD
jgi:hypothetical protein